MHFLIGLILTISSFSAMSAELSLHFNINNLDKKDAHLKVTMESTNPLCAKVVVGIGGVAIGRRYDFITGKISVENNKLTASATYETGGFCNYRLSEVYLYFLNQKNTYFETRISVLDKAEWAGGGLDYLEISTNDAQQLSVICEGEKSHSLSDCVTYNNEKPRARGNAGSFYLWRENIREFDEYEVATLTFKEGI